MSTSSLINANIHRAKEGARVLEEIARFVLRDEMLFKEIRAFRHALIAAPPIDSAQSDLGGVSFRENNFRQNLLEVVQANSLRIQEALRVLEEINNGLEAKAQLKALRYHAYSFHHTVYIRTISFLKNEKLTGLYAVIDPDIIELPLQKMVEFINNSPISIVQFRSKKLSKREVINCVIEVMSTLNRDKLLVINDHLDVAIDIADGVHLGQNDYPIDRVRKMTADGFVLGVSCHNVLEAKLAVSAGASYVSVGCLFSTQSKMEAQRTNLDELERIRRAINVPLCAIGGINHENVAAILAYEVDMVAVLSAIWHDQPSQKISLLCEQINEHQAHRRRHITG